MLYKYIPPIVRLRVSSHEYSLSIFFCPMSILPPTNYLLYTQLYTRFEDDVCIETRDIPAYCNYMSIACTDNGGPFDYQKIVKVRQKMAKTLTRNRPKLYWMRNKTKLGGGVCASSPVYKVN